jgi:hypothetical protein
MGFSKSYMNRVGLGETDTHFEETSSCSCPEIANLVWFIGLFVYVLANVFGDSLGIVKNMHSTWVRSS